LEKKEEKKAKRLTSCHLARREKKTNPLSWVRVRNAALVLKRVRIENLRGATRSEMKAAGDVLRGKKRGEPPRPKRERRYRTALSKRGGDKQTTIRRGIKAKERVRDRRSKQGKSKVGAEIEWKYHQRKRTPLLGKSVNETNGKGGMEAKDSSTSRTQERTKNTG